MFGIRKLKKVVWQLRLQQDESKKQITRLQHELQIAKQKQKESDYLIQNPPKYKIGDAIMNIGIITDRYVKFPIPVELWKAAFHCAAIFKIRQLYIYSS